MVHVFPCHHFISQSVLSTTSEPLVMCCGTNVVYIATAGCFIEVYTIINGIWTKSQSFPTVACVQQIAYSTSEDIIATIEENSVTASDDVKALLSVRVYTNISHHTSSEPISASIAGHMTREKYTIDAKQMRVIEIPLKRSPNCIALDDSTGCLAIGIGKGLLLYGFSNKPNARQRDLKCLLELSFSFNIEKVMLAEEFILCANRHHVQVIQLKFDTKIVSFRTQKADMTRPIIRTVIDQSSSEEFSSTNCSVQETRADPSVKDKYHTTIDFGSLYVDSSTTDVDEKSSCEESSRQPRIKLLKSVQHKLSKQSSEERVMRGPLLGNHYICPVTVEYEGTTDKTLSGVLDQGVIVWLYQRSRKADPAFHSAQLYPVYADRDSASARPNCFTSTRRLNLVGMFCHTSTFSNGHLFNVICSTQPPAEYLYSSKIVQSYISDYQLFALSESTVEIYTCHCLYRLIDNSTEPDKIARCWTPPTPSMIGVYSFMALRRMCCTPEHISLISSSSDDSPTTEDNWSIYILAVPTVPQLATDMIELAVSHRDINQSAHQILLEEAYLLLEGFCFKTHHQLSDILDLFKTVVIHLAESSARSENSSLSVLRSKSHIMAEMSTDDLLDLCLSVQSESYLTSILHMLCMSCSYRLHQFVRSERFVSLPVGDVVLDVLKTYTEQSEKDIGVHCAVASLFICDTLRDTDTIVQLLDTVDQATLTGHLVQCEGYIFTDNNQWTSFSKVFTINKPHILIGLLLKLLASERLTLGDTLRLTQELDTESKSFWSQYLLESLLTNGTSQSSLAADAAVCLSSIYLDNLKPGHHVNNTTASIVDINKLMSGSHGHFVKRRSWLDLLPPCNEIDNREFSCRLHSNPDRVATTTVSVLDNDVDNTDTDEQCRCYLVDIIKLQSLLCSTLGDKNLCDSLLETLDNLTLTCADISLRLLCLSRTDPHKAIDVVIENHWEILVPYVKEIKPTEIALLQYVVQKLTALKDVMEPTSDNNSSTVYAECLNEIYAHLSVTLDNDSFAQIIHNRRSSPETERYRSANINHCLQRDLEQQLVELTTS